MGNSQNKEIVSGNSQFACSSIISKNECNQQTNCIFLNNCKLLSRSNYVSINSIPISDIISGIIEIDNQPEKYNLFLMINNKYNNVLLKSIVINLNNCNNENKMFSSKYYLYPECNIFISNQQDNEFSLKQNDIIHKFNPITSEIVPNVIITEEQLYIIKNNEYKIKLIDIYNNEIIIPILNYPTANETVKIQFQNSVQNLNRSNINNNQGNINQLTT